MNVQYFWLLAFGVVIYVVFRDENVLKAFYYVIESVNANIRRKWWWITNDPSNPVVKYMMYRKNLKLAKELRAKIDNHYDKNK